MSFTTAQALEASLEPALLSADAEKGRAAFKTFDMTGDVALLDAAAFPQLHAALAFLDDKVRPLWQVLDREANERQAKHKWIARIAIVFGVVAVLMVLLQFGLQASEIPGRELAGGIELAAALVAAAAVTAGIATDCDHKWIIARHKAERLRILKFRTLGSPDTWCGSEEKWQAAVMQAVAAIQAISSIDEVEEWAHKVAASAEEPTATGCAVGEAEVQALAAYYRWKRVEHQICYYRNKFKAITGRKWKAAGAEADEHHLPPERRHRDGVWLFLLSILMVIAHFVTERVSHEDKTSLLYQAGVWCLVLAGLIPVLGFGIRAWKGAFEPARSAALCVAKARSLELDAQNLVNTRTDLEHTLRHIAHIEHFFEHEHSEWLRLMLETDWMP